MMKALPKLTLRMAQRAALVFGKLPEGEGLRMRSRLSALSESELYQGSPHDLRKMMEISAIWEAETRAPSGRRVNIGLKPEENVAEVDQMSGWLARWLKPVAQRDYSRDLKTIENTYRTESREAKTPAAQREAHEKYLQSRRTLVRFYLQRVALASADQARLTELLGPVELPPGTQSTFIQNSPYGAKTWGGLSQSQRLDKPAQAPAGAYPAAPVPAPAGARGAGGGRP